MPSPPPRRRDVRVAAAWRDGVWPLLAGASTAVGLVGTWRLTSLVAVALMVAGLWLLVAVVVYGVASESGLRAGTAVRIGLGGAVSVVALVGLTEIFPVAGWFAALAVGLTSPALYDVLAPHVRRATDAFFHRAPSPSAPDQVGVDRLFEQIVIELKKYDA